MKTHNNAHQYKTPFIDGDRQQNTYALTERLTHFFLNEIKHLDNKHAEDFRELLRDLLEYMITHRSIFMNKVVEDLLVGYLHNFSDRGLYNLYGKFKEYKKGNIDKPLEVSDKTIMANID